MARKQTQVEKAVSWPSGTEMIILRMLVGRGEMYGLQMVKESDGAVKRGTIYVTLGRMEDKGFVESRIEDEAREDVGLPRRLYRVTGLGQRAVAAAEGYWSVAKLQGAK